MERDLEGNKHVRYLTINGGTIRESDLHGHYLHTEWQMGALGRCKDLGLTKEILTMCPVDLYRMADRWGVKCRGCSDEKVREMMLEKAIELRMIAYTQAVNKAWKGQPDIFVVPKPSTQVAATETAAIQDTAVAEELLPAEEQKAEELPIKKSKKARRKALQTPLASSGGSESTAQITAEAQGKMRKPTETATSAEWAAWEAQQEVARSEAAVRRATRVPKKRAKPQKRPADDAPVAEQEAWQKRCAMLEKRRIQRDN